MGRDPQLTAARSALPTANNDVADRITNTPVRPDRYLHDTRALVPIYKI